MIKHVLLATSAIVVSFGTQAATAGTITYDDYTGVKTGWQMASDDAYLGSRAGCFESMVRVGYDTALEPGLAELDTNLTEGLGVQVAQGREVPERRAA